MKIKTGRAWAWVLEDGSVCHWAAYSQRFIGGAPSTDALMVRVRIVRETDWRRIVKAAKNGGWK
jgi:hypothetical protein